MTSRSDPVSDSDPPDQEESFKFKKKVDEDWKRKVEEEKERLSTDSERRDRPRPQASAEHAERAGAASGAGAGQAPGPGGGASRSRRSQRDDAAASAGGPSEAQEEPLPDTAFLRFIGDLANQALTALGAYPDPITRTRQVSLEQARYIIDVLRLLREKTKGNLTAEEQRVVDGLLYELQLQYVDMNR